MNNFEKLIETFIESGDLGDYNDSDYTLTLYSVDNNSQSIKRIRNILNEYFIGRYNLITLDSTSNKTNIKIFLNP